MTTRHITERDTSLHSYELSQVIHRERQREIEHQVQSRLWRSSRPPSHSLRRSIGRELIRIGSALEGDGARPVGRLGPSSRREIQL